MVVTGIIGHSWYLSSFLFLDAIYRLPHEMYFCIGSVLKAKAILICREFESSQA